MKRISLQLIIFKIVQLLADANEQIQCEPSFTIAGFKLHGSVFKTVVSSSKTECLSTCQTEKNCRSINFKQGQKQCELNQGNHLTHPQNLLQTDGFTYYDNPSYQSTGTNHCSRNMCSEPLACVIAGSSYDCLPCNQVSGTKELLFFPRKSALDKVEWEHPFVTSLTAFTVSVWAKMDPATSFHSLFSYAVSGSSNEICIHCTGTNTRLIFKNSIKDHSMALIDGHWQHIALTWKNTDGKWRIYINGTSRFEGTQATGQTIIKGGVILGQDADSYLGGYEDNQALQGTLSMVNMWDKELSSAEIAAIYSNKCASSKGNLVKWEDLVTKRFGEVKLSCSRSFCTG